MIPRWICSSISSLAPPSSDGCDGVYVAVLAASDSAAMMSGFDCLWPYFKTKTRLLPKMKIKITTFVRLATKLEKKMSPTRKTREWALVRATPGSKHDAPCGPR